MTIKLSEVSEALIQYGKAIEFAGVEALTKTAILGKNAAKKSLNEEFLLKNKWTEKSIKITPAKFGDKDPFSEVYVKDKYIAEHENGVSRKPEPEGQPVPVEIREAAGISEKKVIPKSMRAKKLAKTTKKVGGNKPFVLERTTKSRVVGRKRKALVGRPRKTAGVWIRTGSDRHPIQLLYSITKRNIRLKPRPWYQEPVNSTYDSQIEPEFNRAVDKAIQRWESKFIK